MDYIHAGLRYFLTYYDKKLFGFRRDCYAKFSLYIRRSNYPINSNFPVGIGCIKNAWTT